MGFRVAPAAHREWGRGPYSPLSYQPFLHVLACIYIIYEIWSKGLFHKVTQRWQSTCRPNAPKDVAEHSVADSFPLGSWNHSFMFMLIWEIYKYRKKPPPKTSSSGSCRWILLIHKFITQASKNTWSLLKVEKKCLLLVMSHLHGKLWMPYDYSQISPLQTSSMQWGYLACCK